MHRAACRKPLTASLHCSPSAACTIANSSSVVTTIIVGPSTLGGMVGGAGLTQRRNDCLRMGVKVTEPLRVETALAAGAAARA